MKTLYICLALIAVVMATFFCNKYIMTQNSQIFTHSTGSYSFEYSENHTITEGGGIKKDVFISQSNNKEELIKIDIEYSPNYIPNLQEKGQHNDTLKIDTQKIGSHNVVITHYDGLGTTYTIPVDGATNPSEFIVLSVLNKDSGDLVNSIIGTLKINLDKISLQTELLKEMRNKPQIKAEYAPGEVLPGEF